MASITDDEIRRRILKLLLKNPSNTSGSWGVHRSIIQETLAIPDKNLDFNMAYLAQKGLVKLVQVHSADWLWAKLTPVGIDVLKNKEQYKERFPFIDSNE